MVSVRVAGGGPLSAFVGARGGISRGHFSSAVRTVRTRIQITAISAPSGRRYASSPTSRGIRAGRVGGEDRPSFLTRSDQGGYDFLEHDRSHSDVGTSRATVAAPKL